MPSWYEVFDNEQVQFLTRKRVFQLTVALLAAGALSLGLLFQTFIYPASAKLVGFGMALIWSIPIGWILIKLRQTRRVTWCIKISNRRIIGYDHARRKTEIDWLNVKRVEVNHDHLRICSESKTLEIPDLYPDFASLGHRITEYADFYRIPICVDGRPLEQLTVRDLYPFIEDDISTGS